MKLEKALRLKRGDCVNLPPDRGSPAQTGTVVSVGSNIAKTLTGVDYIWVTVCGIHDSVWPSNRISK